MKLQPYLVFDGRCREAFRFYQQVLGGELEVMSHAESPIADEVPADWGDLVLHACLTTDGATLMASDSPPEHYAPPQGVYVSLHVDDPAAAERVYAALSEGGTVTMPLEKTFWAERFAMFTDRFGTPWMINCAPAE